MKSYLIILTLCTVFIFGGCRTSTMTKTKFDEEQLAADGYSKIFEEDFSLGLRQWKIWTGGAYNEELQYYRTDNLIITDGILEIRPKKEWVTGPVLPGHLELSDYNYTSGRIESKFEIAPITPTQKIRISARIQMPEGYGMWPAFWLLAQNGSRHSEIDITETTGGSRSFIINSHYSDDSAENNSHPGKTPKKIRSGKSLTDSFHIYELIWTQDSLIFILDGKIIAEKEASHPHFGYIKQLYQDPQHLVLNVAIGGNMFNRLKKDNIETSSMYVDWVKVFSSQ